MNEKERAARLAHDLDLRLEPLQAYTEQTAPEDRPLLELADQLSDQAPFAPTSPERARLRQGFEQVKARGEGRGGKAPFFRALSPALQAVPWIALVAVIFAVTALLIPNLLGRPASRVTGPAPENTATAATTTAATAEPAITLTPSTQPAAFPAQSQTVNGVRMDLRDLAVTGSSLRAVLCYQPPDERGWRIENVRLQANGEAQAFFPSSAGRVPPDADGLVCETFTGPRPAAQAGEWLLTVGRLVGQRNTIPECARVNQQLGQDYPGLSIQCFENGSFAFQNDALPAGMSSEEAFQIQRTYLDAEVRSGYWTFPLQPAEVAERAGAWSAPADPVIVPAACDPHSSLFANPQTASMLRGHYTPLGFAGGGSLKSGNSPSGFTFQMALVCDLAFSRLKPYGSEYSEINGLGVQFTITYQGEPLGENVTYTSGVWPFIMHESGSGPLGSGETTGNYEGLLFPQDTHPDFTQSDVRLRYPVRVRLPDGSVQGAALAFTLLREPEGYRPGDVRVEALTDEERQAGGMNANPAGPLPFPLLPTPTPLAAPSAWQPVIDRLTAWNDGFAAAPGWVHVLQVQQMAGLRAVNGPYKGLTEWMSDAWFLVDNKGEVTQKIHIDTTVEGRVIQKVITKDGKTANLTYLNQMEYTPSRLNLLDDLPFVLAKSSRVEETTVSGRPAWVITLDGRVEAVDRESGARLYSETLGPGKRVDSRTTYLSVERVDAPPEQALAALAQPMPAFTPTPRLNGRGDPNNPITAPTVLGLEALVNQVDAWQDPLKASPGWVYTRQRITMEDGNQLYGGLKEYLGETWYWIDAHGMATTLIHIDQTLDGQPLQQSYIRDGQAVNLTFTGPVTPVDATPFDLAYAIRNARRGSTRVELADDTVDGRPVKVLTIFASGYTRREVIDTTTGQPLYAEMYDPEAGPAPLGRYTGRIRLETAERVKAPPANVLDLLQRQPGDAAPSPVGTPAPQGFDPSHSKLTYHPMPDGDIRTATSWYGDISADGYLLGRVDFGFVPGGGCVRSPGGSRLAFIYTKGNPDGSVISSSLKWFDLRAIATIHEPAPEIVNIGVLSWSTTQEKLAVFGCKANQQGCGLYLFDPLADQLRLLLADVYANWEPIWSPDGSQIAFVDTKDGNPLYVVDIQTGAVVYQGTFDGKTWQPSPGSPTAGWGVTFPRSSSGNGCFEVQ